MLSLILFLQEGDTLKGKGEVYEVREETSKGKSETSETRDEAFKFLAGQALLGCAAYPPAVSFFLLALDLESQEQENVAACAACITPLACLGTSATLALTSPLKKPVAISSFTGALDGMLWSFLIIANIYVNSPETDPKLGPTLFLFGLSGGNAAGYLAGYGGGSEGAYVLKTISAVQLLWAYFQTLRIIYGDKRPSESEYKLHLLMATTLSIGGGLGTFALNVNDYDITAGDALFIGSNTLKGALILSAPITTAYLFSQDTSYTSYSPSGFYFDRVFGRLDGVANLAGAFLGAYISYRIAKKDDLSLLEGIVYSVVPAFAYWAALAPTLVEREYYYRIAPMFQVAFDVGTSILIYRLTKTF